MLRVGLNILLQKENNNYREKKKSWVTKNNNDDIKQSHGKTVINNFIKIVATDYDDILSVFSA